MGQHFNHRSNLRRLSGICRSGRAGLKDPADGHRKLSRHDKTRTAISLALNEGPRRMQSGSIEFAFGRRGLLAGWRQRLSACFLDLGAALADFEFRIAFANDVNSAASLDDLAIGVAVLQCTDAANNFHRTRLGFKRKGCLVKRRSIASGPFRATPNGPYERQFC